jgi:hypothetical protein
MEGLGGGSTPEICPASGLPHRARGRHAGANAAPRFRRPLVPPLRAGSLVWGIVIDRLEKGRIKDTRIIMDTLGLMMQLGVFPPPASAPTGA